MLHPSRCFGLRSALMALGAPLVFVACGEAGLSEPRPSLADAPAGVLATEGSGASLRMLPFEIDASAVLLSQVFAPDFGPPNFGRSTFDGRCSQPADLLISFALEGRATHLGHFTGLAEHCSVLNFVDRTGVEIDGVMVITAANGDELWDAYEGTNASGAPFVEAHTFVGGTGRFAAASGEGVGTGQCDREAGTCVFGLTGEIAYEASDRADAN